MKKTFETKIAPKTEVKVKIAGTGTFNPNQLKAEGVKKADLAAHFEHLPAAEAKAAHEKVWSAMKGNDVAEEQEENTDG